MTAHQEAGTATPRNCPAHFGMQDMPCTKGCGATCIVAEPQKINAALTAAREALEAKEREYSLLQADPLASNTLDAATRPTLLRLTRRGGVMAEKTMAEGFTHMDPDMKIGEFMSDLLQQAIRNESDCMEWDVPVDANGKRLVMAFRLEIRGLLDVLPKRKPS